MSVLIVNPPATLAIGSAIGSGTSGSVLFLDSSGNLAQDNPDFTYDPTKNTLKIRSDGSNNLQEWQDSTGAYEANKQADLARKSTLLKTASEITITPI